MTLIRKAFAGEAQAVRVFWLGLVISATLSVMLLAIAFTVHLKSPFNMIFDVIKYGYNYLFIFCLWRCSINVTKIYWSYFYRFLAILFLCMTTYSAISYFSNEDSTDRVLGVGSVSEILRDGVNDYRESAELQASPFYKRCDSKVDREYSYDAFKVMSDNPAFDRLSNKERNDYLVNILDTQDRLIRQCVGDYENIPQRCLDAFNGSYREKGLDPDLYDNIRKDYVKECIDSANK